MIQVLTRRRSGRWRLTHSRTCRQTVNFPTGNHTFWATNQDQQHISDIAKTINLRPFQLSLVFLSTVNPLLRPSGGTYFLCTFEGGGRGGLL